MQTLAEDPNQKQILLRQISATVRPSRTKAIVSDDETKDETWVTKKGAVGGSVFWAGGGADAMSRCTKRNAPG